MFLSYLRCFFMTYSSWNKTRFFSLHAIVILLLASLFWIAPSKSVWKTLDLFIFQSLNGLLDDHPLQQVFWALSNIRITDVFGALYLAALFLVYIFEAQCQERRKRIASLLFTLVWFEVSILFCKQVLTPIFEQYLHLTRHSPSVDIIDYISLSKVLPWLKVKDSSCFCFPADHGAIVLQWFCFFTYFAGVRRALICIPPIVLLILPRLISGAHWFSDLAVGSVSIILLTFAWATATPLYYHVYSRICRLVKAPTE